MTDDRYINPKNIDLKLGVLEADGELLIPLSAVRAAIAAAPSENVVKVVRCKDCDYYRDIFGYNGKYVKICILHSEYRRSNDYCSDGIRRTDRKSVV